MKRVCLFFNTKGHGENHADDSLFVMSGFSHFKSNVVWKKTVLISKALFFAAFAFLFIQALDSCKKHDTSSSISDVIDVSSVENYTSEITSVSTLSALPAEIKTAATSITTVLSTTEVQTFASANLTDVVSTYTSNLTLSSAEVTALKNNDTGTYSTVITRFSTLPSFTSESKLSSYYTTLQSNSTLKSRLLTSPGVVGDLYATDLYQGALDFKTYTETYTIPVLQKINELKTAASQSEKVNGFKVQALTTEQEQELATLITLTLVNQNTFSQTFLDALESQHSGGGTSSN